MSSSAGTNSGAATNKSWTMAQWEAQEQRLRRAARPQDLMARSARRVLRSFSSSFFLVTRFLPAGKRAKVEMIYAAVRYPDEIVDSFPLTGSDKQAALAQWQSWYQQAVSLPDVSSRLHSGVPWILAGFADVVHENAIPLEHYQSFLDAMRKDIVARTYRKLDDLIDEYVYGSAVVVGYFLAHVYGAAEGASTEDTYAAAENLGIALQLTNFCRDVAEDRARGRLYIPADVVDARGIDAAVLWLAERAEERYRCAAASVGAFAPDTRVAIRACIDVYRSLNRRILLANGQSGTRHSVPVKEKFAALPPAKYWRIPLAYMGAL